MTAPAPLETKTETEPAGRQRRLRRSVQRKARPQTEPPCGPDPKSAARPAAERLEDLRGDGVPPPAPALAADAARGFSAGNGYLTGLIVDRLA